VRWAGRTFGHLSDVAAEAGSTHRPALHVAVDHERAQLEVGILNQVRRHHYAVDQSVGVGVVETYVREGQGRAVAIGQEYIVIVLEDDRRRSETPGDWWRDRLSEDISASIDLDLELKSAGGRSEDSGIEVEDVLGSGNSGESLGNDVILGIVPDIKREGMSTAGGTFGDGSSAAGDDPVGYWHGWRRERSGLKIAI